MPIQLVAENNGTSIRMIEKHYGKFLARDRTAWMDKIKIDISASVIRDRVAQGLSIRHLVPDRVNDYIKQNRLYLRD